MLRARRPRSRMACSAESVGRPCLRAAISVHRYLRNAPRTAACVTARGRAQLTRSIAVRSIKVSFATLSLPVFTQSMIRYLISVSRLFHRRRSFVALCTFVIAYLSSDCSGRRCTGYDSLRRVERDSSSSNRINLPVATRRRVCS